MSHPSYLPDLSSHYFAFSKLKLKLKGDHYASIEGIQEYVTAKLKAIPISDFEHEDRAECIRVSGDYSE